MYRVMQKSLGTRGNVFTEHCWRSTYIYRLFEMFNSQYILNPHKKCLLWNVGKQEEEINLIIKQQMHLHKITH